MTINAANVSYIGQGPVAGGSTILAFAGSSELERAYIGTITVIGDGANTSAVINYMDGTNVLGWVPTAVTFDRTGGNAANSIVSYCNTPNNAACVMTFSTAPGSNASVIGLIQIYK